MTNMPKNWAVFISGTGSNLGALLEVPFFVNVRLVVASKASAYGISRARRAGIPVEILSNPIDWSQLTQCLRTHNVESLYLAGFMKILPEKFVLEWKERILNVHPSLLPSYPGLRSIQRAFDDGKSVGATVHEVTAEVDAGKIVAQRQTHLAETIDLTEFQVHVAEQALARKVVETWNR